MSSDVGADGKKHACSVGTGMSGTYLAPFRVAAFSSRKSPWHSRGLQKQTSVTPGSHREATSSRNTWSASQRASSQDL